MEFGAGKILRRKIIEYVRSVDTITTRLLILVLFITVIPLMVISNLSTNILNQSMFDIAQNELELSAKISREEYKDELEKLKFSIIQAKNGYIQEDYNKFLKKQNKESLNKSINLMKQELNLDFCLLVNHHNKIIINHEIFNIKENKDVLSKIANSAMLGESIASTESLQFGYIDKKISENKEAKEKVYNLFLIFAVPVYEQNNELSAVLLVGKNFTNSKNISELVKYTTGATLAIYQIINNDLKIITTNLTGIESNLVKKVSDPDLLSAIETGRSITVKEQILNEFEIGKYEFIKNYNGNIIGAIYVGITENSFIQPGKKIIGLISSISVISLIVAIFLAALFSRKLTSPILKLVYAAKAVASGDLTQTVEVDGSDEVSQLVNAFNKMTKNLQRQEQLRDNFVATLTHDLKVPMLAENQTVSYLLKEAYGPINEEQKEVLELIKSTNNSSLEMVSTLLEVYRYDAGNAVLIKSKFNIVDLFKKSIKEIQSLADEKKIMICLDTTQDEIFIEADEREVKRVIHNLISNAINNGIKMGHINCSIGVVNGEGNFYNPKLSTDVYTTLKSSIDISNTVLISIKDDGIGIQREDIPQLFQRFALNKGRKPSGSGLGLYYSYQVITQHNGNIWAESSERNGSTFFFTLPV